MATVWIPPEYKSVAERLVSADKAVFPTFMDLFLFAAVLGFSRELKMPDLSTRGGSEISSQVFHNQNKIGVVYLMAIAEMKSLELLKEDKERDCFEIIQAYANGGLHVIQQWLSENESDTEEEILLARINEAAQEIVNSIEHPADDVLEIDISSDI